MRFYLDFVSADAQSAINYVHEKAKKNAAEVPAGIYLLIQDAVRFQFSRAEKGGTPLRAQIIAEFDLESKCLTGMTLSFQLCAIA